jgi:hypothetical protein
VSNKKSDRIDMVELNRIAMRNYLHELMTKLSFNIRQCADRACHNNFLNYKTEIAQMKMMIEDFDILHEEYVKNEKITKKE